jgi:transcription elongation factor Elf1
MSDTILKIIPSDPFYTCKEKIQQDVISLLSKFYSREQIELSVTDSVEFIDQGENFENVSCNLCGQLLEIEDWQNLMDIAFITTCCKKETSLNTLKYNSPAGFAKFTICLTNIKSEPRANELSELIALLQCEVRIIWAKY